MQLKCKIESVSPAMSGVARNGNPWRCCNIILGFGEDRILCKAWGNECDFCQQYDNEAKGFVTASVEMEVYAPRTEFSDRKYQVNTLRSVAYAEKETDF